MSDDQIALLESRPEVREYRSQRKQQQELAELKNQRDMRFFLLVLGTMTIAGVFMWLSSVL